MQKICQRHFKMSFFAETEYRFLQGSIQVLYSLIHHITCRLEARQAQIYQLVSGLMGENGKYNYSKAVHLYPPFFDIFCSPKNYKTTSALTMKEGDMMSEEEILKLQQNTQDTNMEGIARPSRRWLRGLRRRQKK